MKKYAFAVALGLAAAPAFAGGPLAPVTGILGGVPVVGPALGNVTGSLPALPALPALGGGLPALPALTATLGVVVQGKGVIVGVNTASMPPVSVATVGLPALPPLPGLPN